MKKTTQTETKQPRVLLVVKDALFLETLIKRLRKAGMFAMAARSDQELTEILDNKVIDVVLLDIREYSDAAIQSLTMINQKQPLVQTILISSTENIRQSMAGMKHGASDDITAPCEVVALIAKIREAWGRRQQILRK